VTQISRPLIEYLKTASALRKRRSRMWGDPRMAALCECVLLGDAEGKPWDMTSIASEVGASRATAHRLVEQGEAKGYIMREQHGRSVLLRPTKKAVECISGYHGEAIVKIFLTGAQRTIEVS
jgi:DNA-binding MarR family transcriptional regulator